MHFSKAVVQIMVQYKTMHGIWSFGYKSTDSSTLGTPVLSWNSTGNVGIGTTGPEGKLHVAGAGLAEGSGIYAKYDVLQYRRSC